MYKGYVIYKINDNKNVMKEYYTKNGNWTFVEEKAKLFDSYTKVKELCDELNANGIKCSIECII